VDAMMAEEGAQETFLTSHSFVLSQTGLFYFLLSDKELF